MKFIALFFVASVFNGVSWWAVLIADSRENDVLELIQLGGTGGLILALLSAVSVLWKYIQSLKIEWREEVAELRRILVEERVQHRSEIAQLRREAEVKYEQLGERYTEELRQQIRSLRAETNQKISDVREELPGGEND